MPTSVPAFFCFCGKRETQGWGCQGWVQDDSGVSFGWWAGSRCQGWVRDELSNWVGGQVQDAKIRFKAGGQLQDVRVRFRMWCLIGVVGRFKMSRLGAGCGVLLGWWPIS